MNRFLAPLLLLSALLWPLAALAQDDPRLEVELPEGEIIVGQPVTLRLKLLVPTWMPKPPVWPGFEVPSLMVRLPERASTPVSESIGGETWSGISRAYRLYPLATGAFEIPAQKLIVTYADPGQPEPIQAELAVEAIRFTATLPKGASDLNPPIVAQGFTVTQQIDGGLEDGGPDLVVGDAITRTVTASIAGTTPILIPALIADIAPTDAGTPLPLRAYPKEPVVRDKEERGVMSGSRTDVVTYVAQTGGTASLPPITLRWFNLDSGKIEVAELEGISLTIALPPPPPPGPADYARIAAAFVALLGLVWLFVRYVWPRLRGRWHKIQTAWITSEPYAARQMNRALRAGSLGGIYAALDLWTGFYPGLTGSDRQPLDNALAGLGAARYAADGTRRDEGSQQAASAAFATLRRDLRARKDNTEAPGALAPLNPQFRP